MIEIPNEVVERLSVAMVQISILAALGLVIGWTLRKLGPAWRSAIFRSTLIAALALPILSVLLANWERGAWHVPPVPAGPKFTIRTIKPEVIYTQLPPEAEARVQARVAAEEADRKAHPGKYAPEHRHTLPPLEEKMTPRDMAVWIWLAGALAILLWRLTGWAMIARIRLQSTQPPATALALLDYQSKECGIFPPQVFASESIQGPFLCGIFRPKIFLPSEITQVVNIEELRGILAHELTHVVRRDCLWAAGSRLLTLLAWWNPLAWFLARGIESSAEELCDQVVVQGGLDRRAYADSLLKVSASMSGSRLERQVGVGVVSIRSSLGKRISLILDGSLRTMTRLSRRTMAGVFGTTAFALAAVAVLVAGQAAQAAKIDPKALAFWRETTDAYAKLTSLSMRTEEPAGMFGQPTQADLIYSRPGWAHVSVFQLGDVKEAATIYARPDRYYVTDSKVPGQYMTGEEPQLGIAHSPMSDQFANYGLRFGLQAAGFREEQVVDFLTPAVLTGRSPMFGTLSFGPDVTLDGVLCHTITGDRSAAYGSPCRIEIAVGAADHLIRKWTEIYTANTRSQPRVWTYTNVKANFALQSKSLAFTPPKSWKVAATGATGSRITSTGGNYDWSYLLPDGTTKSGSGTKAEMERRIAELQAGPRDVASVLNAFNRATHSFRTLSFRVDGTYTSPQDRRPATSSMRAILAKGGKFLYTLMDDPKASQPTSLLSDGRYEYELEPMLKGECIRWPYSEGNIQAVWDAQESCPMAIRFFYALAGGPEREGILDSTDPYSMAVKPGLFEGEPVDIVTQTTRYNDQFGFKTAESDVVEVDFSRQTHLPLRARQWGIDKAGVVRPVSDVETFHDYAIDRPIPPNTFKLKGSYKFITQAQASVPNSR